MIVMEIYYINRQAFVVLPNTIPIDSNWKIYSRVLPKIYELSCILGISYWSDSIIYALN